MSSHGVVRSWHDDDGWGIIDSAQTPGGCWAHYSAVAIQGYRKLSPGQRVKLEWEAANQDGFAFRATKAWPVGQADVDAAPQGPSGIYSSTLTIHFDDEE
jgi:CspA family cold shock protein